MTAQRLQALTTEVGRQALAQIRLVATDMDGTLTQGEAFTPALMATLERLNASGMPVLITTGRSAGWVHGVLHYLPVVLAIAENGGLYFTKENRYPTFLQSIANNHRQLLLQQFERLRQKYPQLKESSDNLFRLTDWTFDVTGLSLDDLQWMTDSCHKNGWGFTYSTVQCHIKPLPQDKASGLAQVVAQQFCELSHEQVLTVGDSPNDESMFDPGQFPNSVGVANVRHYLDALAHHPAFVTQAEEGKGFSELADRLLNR
ncbi:HAD family phosphatase [Leptolyngbya cf. ectocarpi LEGE 11479]|uniref:HAD family phosphatase n=1 Tax=Leptolyngbya cf. ectocarpi LEGE 11479 TaxID=1828722 RepID=A0A929F8L3_LEPEC|nr:HAD family hydrolase [Leptolyngbya ectocarpi]MBE9068871.1 HAD family phosphatase [Leptolyngbya cf. ectocarpi LEGE 11479]